MSGNPGWPLIQIWLTHISDFTELCQNCGEFEWKLMYTQNIEITNKVKSNSTPIGKHNRPTSNSNLHVSSTYLKFRTVLQKIKHTTIRDFV